jgi:hypothetical protein
VVAILEDLYELVIIGPRLTKTQRRWTKGVTNARGSGGFKETVSFVGCILLTKSQTCNVAVIIRNAVYFRIFKVFTEGYFSVQRRFCADSN